MSNDFDFSRLHVKVLYSFFKNRATEHFKQAFRPYYGLVLKLSGVSRYTAGKKSYILSPGRMMLIPRGANYEIFREEYGEYLIVDFDLAENIPNPENRLYIFDIVNFTEMTRLFSEAERIWTFKKSAYYSRTMSLLYRIFAELERESVGYYLDSSRRELIREAGKYLESHIADPELSTERLAEVAGLSQSHFRKLFGQVYKNSPGQYISRVRIEKAKTLLASGECSIGEIAEQVGYSSIYYFSAAFKRSVGISPSEYAQSVGQTLTSPKEVALQSDKGIEQELSYNPYLGCGRKY